MYADAPKGPGACARRLRGRGSASPMRRRPTHPFAETSARVEFGAASRRVLRWVPGRIPLRCVRPGKAVDESWRSNSQPRFAGSLEGARTDPKGVEGYPGTQRKTLPRSGAELDPPFAEASLARPRWGNSAVMKAQAALPFGPGMVRQEAAVQVRNSAHRYGSTGPMAARRGQSPPRGLRRLSVRRPSGSSGQGVSGGGQTPPIAPSAPLAPHHPSPRCPHHRRTVASSSSGFPHHQ